MGITASAPKSVARAVKSPDGGGASISIDRARTEAKTSGSAEGRRWGSVRSVSDASPTRTSLSDERSASALCFARARRVGPRSVGPGEHRAGRVDHEERLGAHPNLSIVPARDDGLGRGETDEDRDEDERGEHG